MTKKVEVYGRVQGVFFRDNVKKYCDKNGIKGEITNRGDGSVLIIAQCSKDKLIKLKNWIRESPGVSKVERVDESDDEGGKVYDDFKIVILGSYLADKGKALKNLLKR